MLTYNVLFLHAQSHTQIYKQVYMQIHFGSGYIQASVNINHKWPLLTLAI